METSIKYFTDFFLYKNFVKMNSPEKKCPLCSRIEINSKIFSPSNQLHIIKNKYVRTWFQPTIATSVDWDSLLKKCIRWFHCHMFSETPLSLAVNVKSKSSKMLIALVNGGAIVDFRNKTDGSTALHRTVAKSNIEALQTLLDLGMYNGT